MSARLLEYKAIIEDIVANRYFLDEEEKSALTALLSTAETQVLAAMADNYPTEIVKK